MNIFLSSDNPLFVMAQRSRYLAGWFVATLMTIVFAFGVPLGIATLVYQGGGLLFFDRLSKIPNAFISAFGYILYQTSQFAPILLALWVWLWLVEKRTLRTLGFERQGGWYKFFRGALLGIIMIGVTISLLALLRVAQPQGATSNLLGLAAVGGVLLAFVGWLIQAIVQEALFRGWLLQVLGDRYRPIVGIIVSTLLFTAFNVAFTEINVLFIVNSLLFGLFAALYALRDGNIWGIIGLRAAWSWSEGNIFGTLVNGSSYAGGGQLISLKMTAPTLVSGGAQGPEGGIIVTLILLVALVLVVVLKPRVSPVVSPIVEPEPLPSKKPTTGKVSKARSSR